MSTFAIKKSNRPSKVHHSEYIRLDNKPGKEDIAPAAPPEPTKPEAE